MSDITLSEKEQKLLDFIKSNEDVTIKLIELQLGTTYVGALGKLMGYDLIKSEKRNLTEKTEDKYLNKYGKKWTKCYFVREDMDKAVKEVNDEKTRPSMQGDPESIKLGEK